MNCEIILILYLFVMYCEGKKQSTQRLLELSECDNIPEDKYYKEGRIEYSFKVQEKYGSQMLVGNVTIPIKSPPFTFSLRQYAFNSTKQYGSKEKGHQILNIKDISCKNPLVLVLFQMSNLKIDKECRMLPGMYTLKNFNISKMNSAKFLLSLPGIYLYEAEISTRKGIIACLKSLIITYDTDNV